MMKRVPPKEMAFKLMKILKKQRPDPNYLKKVFEHVRRELEMQGRIIAKKKLPKLLTEEEMNQFYEAVWKTANPTHMVMIKLLLFTGLRIAELANIALDDVDLRSLKVRIQQGKGKKDRYVPIPESFRGELTQYIKAQQKKGAHFLFESNRMDKFTTRWIREIIKKYARQAEIEKRIYPHLFRHQLLTFLTQKGIIDAKIQLISGHEDRKSLAIYQDLSLADVEKEYREAMKDFPVK